MINQFNQLIVSVYAYDCIKSFQSISMTKIEHYCNTAQQSGTYK